MSQALRDVIPIMGLLQEMRERDFKVLCTKPYVYCKVFEDNSGTLNWQGFPSFALEPSTSTYATIIFANMCKRGLSKYSPSTLRIRLLMLLSSSWHKMVFNVIVASCAASDLHKLPK
jgi:hypothetical protein